jgi:hypothetical protein
MPVPLAWVRSLVQDGCLISTYGIFNSSRAGDAPSGP